jgi:hypothetical protein
MTRPTDEDRPAAVPPPPTLPEVESPPLEDVIDGVPSKEEVVENAETADDIIRQQPSVEEILGSDR